MDNVLIGTIFKILGFVAIYMAAADLLKWSVTAQYDNSSTNFISDLASNVVNLPSQIVCYILNVALQLIEFAVKAVFDLVSINVNADMDGIPCN